MIGVGLRLVNFDDFTYYDTVRPLVVKTVEPLQFGNRRTMYLGDLRERVTAFNFIL